MTESLQSPHDRPGAAAAIPDDNTTITEVIDGYRTHGFAADMFAEAGPAIRCGHCDVVSDARLFEMHSMRRMEGASDPSDMVAVVATACPACGSQGTLVVGFGPMSSETDSDVLMAVRDSRADHVLPPGSSPDELPSSGGAPTDSTLDIVGDQNGG